MQCFFKAFYARTKRAHGIVDRAHGTLETCACV